MKYIDQSAADLSLLVLADPVDFSGLNIIRTTSLVRPEFTITAHIIGGSHAIMWQFPDFTIGEVFSCHKDIAAPNTVLNQGLKELLLADAKQLIGNQSYHFKAEKRRLSCLESSNDKLCLEYAFAPRGGGATPKTRITIAPDGRTIRTIHFYPHEETAIYTTTQLEGE